MIDWKKIIQIIIAQFFNYGGVQMKRIAKLIKCVYYVFLFFVIVVVNKIPSRHIRKEFYQLLGAIIGGNTVICHLADLLYPKGLEVKDNVAVGWYVHMDEALA